MKVPEIWVTVGKQGFNDDDLRLLRDYPITGIRINTGRSSLEWTHQTIVKLLKLGFKPQQIFLDVGNKKPRIELQNDDRMILQVSDTIYVYNQESKTVKVRLCSNSFFEQITLQDIVYFGDGEFECTVSEVTQKYVKLVSLSAGILTNNIAVGIVGKNLSKFQIKSDEINLINDILSKYPVSLILSFVEQSDNIIWARKVFPNAYEIIPKIETFDAVENFTSIIGISKKIFIGRGDLGLSIGMEKVGIVQKKLVTVAHENGCYVAIGTGILDSLKWNQAPLRAEIIDITNSCYESVEAIVLTSETAGAKNPFKAIDFLMQTLQFIKSI